MLKSLKFGGVSRVKNPRRSRYRLFSAFATSGGLTMLKSQPSRPIAVSRYKGFER